MGRLHMGLVRLRCEVCGVRCGHARERYPFLTYATLGSLGSAGEARARRRFAALHGVVIQGGNLPSQYKADDMYYVLCMVPRGL